MHESLAPLDQSIPKHQHNSYRQVNDIGKLENWIRYQAQSILFSEITDRHYIPTMQEATDVINWVYPGTLT